MFSFRRKKRLIPKQPPTYKDYINLSHLCSKEVQDEDLEILRQQPRPDVLCCENVPENLNGLTYGQLDDMRRINEKEDVAYQLSQIIFGKTLDLLSEDVNKVFGFINFCVKEIERINELFASLKMDYTSEEKQAGVENLNFGSFGVLDWYAKRMGITNQNDVRDIAWVRIYQCMKNDHEQNEFERRLQNVYMGKTKMASSHNKPRRR